MKVLDNENIQVESLPIEIEETGLITNVYILKDKKASNAVVIDPAFDANQIENKIQEMNAKVESVIITHAHADHISALAKLTKDTDAKVYVNIKDYDGLYDGVLNEEEVVKTKVEPANKDNVEMVDNGDYITCGETKFEVISTPGHTKGSMVLVDEKNNIMFSGDTIFSNTYGRTDLVTGSHEDMKKTLDNILNRFEDITVFPGHGDIFNLKDSKRKIRLLFAYKG